MEKDAPTVESLGLDMDSIEGVQEVLDKARENRRTAKEGELLGETDVGGAKIRWRKQSSMVREGDRPLPERVMVYDKKGLPSLVPTAQLGYHLSKRNKWTGEKKFFSNPPPGTKPPEPIDKECPICVELYGKSRPFYSIRQWRRHLELVHPAEWGWIQEDEKLKREEEQRELVLAAIRERQAAPEKPPAAEYPCRKCGRVFDSERGRDFHERRWCKEGS